MITIAKITGVHGVKGLVKLKPIPPHDVASLQSFTQITDDQNVTYDLIPKFPNKGILVAELSNVPDRTQAEKLIGRMLCVPQDQLGEHTPYQAEILALTGLMAFDQDGNELGQVTGVVNYGASDLLEILPAPHAETILIPATDDFVIKIDEEAETITINAPKFLGE